MPACGFAFPFEDTEPRNLALPVPSHLCGTLKLCSLKFLK